MSDRPMGFGPPGPSDPEDDGDELGQGSATASDPFAELFAGGDPEAMARALQAAGAGDVDADQVRAMMGQVQKLLSTPGDGGPVNWQLAGDVARQVVSEHGDADASAQAEQRAVDEALRLADTWLTEATTLPAAGARGLAWSRAEWVEGTKPVWRRLVEPVAESVARALSDALAKQIPPELAGPLAAAGPGGPGEAMMRQIGGSVFGHAGRPGRRHAGHRGGQRHRDRAAAGRAGRRRAGARPGSPRSARVWTSRRTRCGSTWRCARRPARGCSRTCRGCRRALLGAVEDYARGIAIDTDRIESALRETDPSDPASMQQALASGLFEPERTPGPAGRRWTGWRPRWPCSRAGSRWSPTPRRARCRTRTRCARRSAAGGPSAARPSRPSRRWSASSCGRAGCATPRRCGG